MRHKPLHLRASNSRDSQITITISGTDAQVESVRAATLRAVAQVAEFPIPPDFKPVHSGPPRHKPCGCGS